jgi:hypothetical protein
MWKEFNKGGQLWFRCKKCKYEFPPLYPQYYRTVKQRFWRFFGFRAKLPKFDKATAKKYPANSVSHFHERLTFGGRLRLLLSGQLLIRIEARTKEKVRVIIAHSLEAVPPRVPGAYYDNRYQ